MLALAVHGGAGTLSTDELTPERQQAFRSGLEAAVRALAESKGLGAGKYIHPLRVALLGVASSPPIFDVAVALGRERTLARVDRLISSLAG